MLITSVLILSFIIAPRYITSSLLSRIRNLITLMSKELTSRRFIVVFFLSVVRFLERRGSPFCVSFSPHRRIWYAKRAFGV